jgi:hypothetical protein
VVVLTKSKTAWAAAFGFAIFWIGIGWGVVHDFVVKHPKLPPGWIVYWEPYKPASILAKAGLLIFLVAIIVETALGTYRFISRLTHKHDT